MKAQSHTRAIDIGHAYDLVKECINLHPIGIDDGQNERVENENGILTI